MTIHPDFEELFALLEKHRVDYMIVGGYAVAFHGYPRLTQDIDLFFLLSPENIGKLRAALMEFGFAGQELPETLFTREGNILTFGVEPLRVDLMNRIDGVTYAEAKPNFVKSHYGKASVFFIGKQELIRNKTASGRPQDKVDADNLR